MADRREVVSKGGKQKHFYKTLNNLKKIVITGPESSGKSWLTAQLGAHFKAPFALEYARIYLEKHGADYTFDSLEKIIRGHLAYQKEYVDDASSLAFLDTDLINFKIWEEMVFGKTHGFLEEAIAKEQDHIYLLSYPDLPWEADPLRENPENRLEIFERHKLEIERLGRAYRIVKGEGEERLQKAITCTMELLNQ